LEFSQDELISASQNLHYAASSRAGGSMRMLLWAHAMLARTLVDLGDWATAMSWVERSHQLLNRSGITLTAPLLFLTGAEVAARRGLWDQAHDYVQKAASLRSEYPIMSVPTMMARAHVAMCQSDHETVLRALTPLADGENHLPPTINEPGFWPWQDMYAIALISTGQVDAADRFLTAHEALATQRHHRSTSARLMAVRGRIQASQGDVDGSRHTFDQALSQIRRLPMPYLTARIHFAYGQTLRRCGKRRDAETQLYRARDAFAVLGADSSVASCDEELLAANVASQLPSSAKHSSDNSVLDALTPREQSVAKMVARGLSNKEVASSLFMSVKTVQYHLTRIYRALGVRSRSELAAMVGGRN
jgi:ATP/maltotriose-dependent transcriptional regulator MalT